VVATRRCGRVSSCIRGTRSKASNPSQSPVRLSIWSLPGPRRSWGGEPRHDPPKAGARSISLWAAPARHRSRARARRPLLLINVHHIVGRRLVARRAGREAVRSLCGLVEGRARAWRAAGAVRGSGLRPACSGVALLHASRGAARLLRSGSPLRWPSTCRGDRPRPAAQSFRGGELPVVVTGEIAARLVSLARRRGRPFFMALLAFVCGAALPVSGQDDWSSARWSPTAAGRRSTA